MSMNLSFPSSSSSSSIINGDLRDVNHHQPSKQWPTRIECDDGTTISFNTSVPTFRLWIYEVATTDIDSLERLVTTEQPMTLMVWMMTANATQVTQMGLTVIAEKLKRINPFIIVRIMSIEDFTKSCKQFIASDILKCKALAVEVKKLRGLLQDKELSMAVESIKSEKPLTLNTLINSEVKKCNSESKFIFVGNILVDGDNQPQLYATVDLTHVDKKVKDALEAASHTSILREFGLFSSSYNAESIYIGLICLESLTATKFKEIIDSLTRHTLLYVVLIVDTPEPLQYDNRYLPHLKYIREKRIDFEPCQTLLSQGKWNKTLADSIMHCVFSNAKLSAFSQLMCKTNRSINLSTLDANIDSSINQIKLLKNN